MIRVYVGKFTDEWVTDIAGHFSIAKKAEWFEDSFVRKAINVIDNSEVLMGECIISPVFGAIAPDRLSSGCKALILMRMQPEYIIYATRCGDNCFPLIQELSELQDLRIGLHHCPRLPEDFSAFFVDSGKEVHSRAAFVEEYYETRHKVTEL